MNVEKVREFRKFKAEGINPMLSEEDKALLNELKVETEKLIEENKKLKKAKKELLTTPKITFTTIKGKTFTRNALAVDYDYTDDQRILIFTHGKTGYKIWFLNTKKQVCVVNYCEKRKNEFYVCVTFNVYKREGNTYTTKMTLNRFLHLIEAEEFKIQNKKFVSIYLKPYKKSNYVKTRKALLDSLIKINKDRTEDVLNNEKYISLLEKYNLKRNSLTSIYRSIVAEERREVAPTKPTRMVIKREKLDSKQNEIKTLLNSVVTEQEEAYFLGWVCGNVKKATVKVVDRGVSAKVIQAAYPDEIYGAKYIEKANSSGWDAAGGKIIFKTTEHAPIKTFKALSTIKHLKRTVDKGETVFKGKTIQNLDLTLYLLQRLVSYGFVLGQDNLNTQLNVKDIVANEIEPQNYGAFFEGYYAND